MLVDQEREIAKLRTELIELRQQREPSPSDSEAPASSRSAGGRGDTQAFKLN